MRNYLKAFRCSVSLLVISLAACLAPVVSYAQDSVAKATATIPAANPWLTIVGGVTLVIFPMIAPRISRFIVGLATDIHLLPTIWQQVVVGGVGVVLSATATKFGVSLPGSLSGFTPDVVVQVLNAATAGLVGVLSVIVHHSAAAHESAQGGGQ